MTGDDSTQVDARDSAKLSTASGWRHHFSLARPSSSSFARLAPWGCWGRRCGRASRCGSSSRLALYFGWRGNTVRRSELRSSRDRTGRNRQPKKGRHRANGPSYFRRAPGRPLSGLGGLSSFALERSLVDARSGSGDANINAVTAARNCAVIAGLRAERHGAVTKTRGTPGAQCPRGPLYMLACYMPVRP